MLKKYCILVICVLSFLLTSGCFKIETPSETMKIPEYSEADAVFNKYKKMLSENQSPKKLLDYLVVNISKLSKSTADIAVVRVIELQKKQLVKYQEKLTDKNYLSQIENIENKEIHDITDKAIRDWVVDVRENGFMIKNNTIEVDYNKINQIADKYVSDELKDYIKIESEESTNKYSEQESLDSFLLKQSRVESYILGLTAALNKTFEYKDNYPDSPHIFRINQLKASYLHIFFLGSPNNSAFAYYQGYDKPNNILSKSWSNAYALLKTEYSKNSAMGVFIENYYNELTKNKNILTESLYDYITDKIGNQ